MPSPDVCQVGLVAMRDSRDGPRPGLPGVNLDSGTGLAAALCHLLPDRGLHTRKCIGRLCALGTVRPGLRKRQLSDPNAVVARHVTCVPAGGRDRVHPGSDSCASAGASGLCRYPPVPVPQGRFLGSR